MLPRGMSPSGVLCLLHGPRPQDNDRMPWYLPVVLGIKQHGATAVIDTLKIKSQIRTQSMIEAVWYHVLLHK